MREICTSGSEGGRAQTNELSLPLSFRRFVPHSRGHDLPARTLVTCNKLGTKLKVGGTLVSRSINTVTFVASATASSSRSDDDAMSVTSWRRSDKEIDAVPLPPFGLMGVAGDLCVACRRRCPCIASSSLLDLPSQASSANVILFMELDTWMLNPLEINPVRAD